MPQGGVDKGEDFTDAMKRELYEETRQKYKGSRVLTKCMSTNCQNLVGIIWKGKYRGQKKNGLSQNF